MSRPSLNVGYLGINRGHTPLDNPLVRQAIAHAINRPASIAAHLRRRHAGRTAVSAARSSGGTIPSLADYSYDPVLAKSLLAQAGYPNGFATTLAYRNVARGLSAEPSRHGRLPSRPILTAVGISCPASSSMESGAFLDNVDAGNVDLFLLGWVRRLSPSCQLLRTPFLRPTPSGLARATTCCAASWRLQRIDPDLSSQLTRYRWAAGRVHSTLPALPLVHTTTSSLTVRWDVKGLAGLTVGHGGIP